MNKNNTVFKQAKFIGSKNNENTYCLQKEFIIKEEVKQATCKASALGLYVIYINGKRVDNRYLTPGWTSYNKMLQYQTYDVKEYLQKGINKIELVVNVGWYAGRLLWTNNFNVYGKTHAGILELDINGIILGTDLDWDCLTTKIVSSSIYDGEIIDFNRDIKKLESCIVDYDMSLLVEQINEPVRNIEELKCIEVIHTLKGDTVYDFGQNMAGVVAVKVPDDFVGKMTLTFAEILIDNEFYTDNLRSAKATDEFINPKGLVCPEFTFHGFRYMKCECSDGTILPKEAFTVYVRHTDMVRTGFIHSSDKALDKLMQNITWGERSNFVDIPTDCPQRDERLGWTGDINAFCKTAAYNYDTRLMIKKFLNDLRNDQAETGEIPHIAPDCLHGLEPSAYWTDAICMVPYKMYQMFGDISYLTENLEAMKKYIACLERRMENGLLVKGQVYGDWLALDNEVVFKEDSIGRTNKLFLGNVFYLEDCKIVSEIYQLLNDNKGSQEYKNKYDYTLSKMREEYFNVHGKLMLDTITAQVLTIYFNIVKEENKEALVQELVNNIQKRHYHVTTGFIGTPYILFALAENGRFDVASKMLLNHEFPGWLYEVDMGATTTWERWSSLMPDGKPDSRGMNSYNHYAYGAVKEFVYEKVLGIQAIEPGFKKIQLRPNVMDGVNKIFGEYRSVNGIIKSSYEVIGEKIIYDFEIDKNIEANILVNGLEKPIIGNGLIHLEINK